MKTLLALIIIAALGIGAWFLWQSGAPTDDAQTMEDDTMMESDEDTMMEDDNAMEEDAMVDASADVSMSVDANAEVVNIDGFNFDYSVKEIRVKEGDTVTINLTSTDGFHDWNVDEFNASTERVNTGETTSVTFVADKAGTYEYYCSVGNHRAMGMVGTLIVE